MFLYLLWVLGTAHAETQLKETPPQTVQIQPQQRSQDTINPQTKTETQAKDAQKAPMAVPPVRTPSADRESKPKAEDTGEEGTEWFPPILGYKLKVTDSIIAIFTVLLFLATFALWISTRRLVRGAEETSERQLRAYVGVISGACDITNGGHGTIEVKVRLRIKNVGQTPAHNVVSTVEVGIFDRSAVDGFIIFEEIEGRVYLFPKAEHIIKTGIKRVNGLPLTEDAGLFVYGKVVYVDVFNKKRSTNFRFIVATSDGNLAAANYGNEAD